MLGGGRASGDGLANGHFFEPTIFAGVEPMDRIGQEEIFGPVLSVIPVDDYGAAMLALNQTRYGLSSSVFTRDVNLAFRAMRDFETGIVYVNAGTTGAEVHLPFGGWKETGNGHREAGHVALDTYTEWKSIYVDFCGRLQRAVGRGVERQDGIHRSRIRLFTLDDTRRGPRHLPRHGAPPSEVFHIPDRDAIAVRLRRGSRAGGESSEPRR